MEHSTSFSFYRNLQDLEPQQLRRALPALVVGGVEFRPLEVMSDDHRATIRYQHGSRDEVTVNVVRAGSDSGRIYGIGQLGDISFGQDLPGFPLSDHGFTNLEAALDRDFDKRRERANCTIAIPSMTGDLGYCLAESGVAVATEDASLPHIPGKPAVAKTLAKD